MSPAEMDVEGILLELREAWPEWGVEFVELDDQSELYDISDGRILIDLEHWRREGPAFAVRHVLAHLDWGHVDASERFTDEQCDLADWVAGLHTLPQRVG